MSVGLQDVFASMHSSPSVRSLLGSMQGSVKPPCPTTQLGSVWRQAQLCSLDWLWVCKGQESPSLGSGVTEKGNHAGPKRACGQTL